MFSAPLRRVSVPPILLGGSRQETLWTTAEVLCEHNLAFVGLVIPQVYESPLRRAFLCHRLALQAANCNISETGVRSWRENKVW